MARKKRISFPGAVHHVMNRGVERRDIFVDEADKQKRLELLARTVKNYSLRLYAFVLMDNHDHYFFRTSSANLSAAMHYFNSLYCNWFNLKHKREGHLFQGRFKSQLVDEGSYFQEISRYIHLNPVRAGLVQKPEDYPWSSYGGYLNPDQRLPWIVYSAVLDEISHDNTLATRLYKDFIDAAISDPDIGELNPLSFEIFGSEDYLKRVEQKLGDQRQHVPLLIKEREKPSPREIENRLVRITGVVIPDFSKMRRDNSITRPLLAWAGRVIFEMNNSQVCQWLNIKNKASICRMLERVEAEVDNLEWIREQLLKG